MSEINLKKGLIGAAGGFATAFAIDLSAWSRSNEAFDWKLAAKRWVAGAIIGFNTAMGFAAVTA